MMLREYFIELYKLKTKKEKVGDKELNNFIRKMNLTIKSVQKIINQKIEEYIENEN